MITDYKDPSVTLNQVYKASTVGTTPALGACIIGPNYFVRTYSDLKESLRLDSQDNYAKQDYSVVYTPADGLSFRYFPGRETKDGSVDEDSVKVLVKNAQLQYLPEFGASDSITTDAVYGTDTISIKQEGISYVFNGAGSDTSVPAVQAGDAVKITVAGDTVDCYVQGFLRDDGGKYTKCVLTKSLPQGDITAVSFRRVVDCYVNQAYVTVRTVDGVQQVSIQPNAEATVDLGIGQTEYPILTGAFYVEYRCRSNRYVGNYGMVADIDDVQGMLGKVCADNPLGVAVACAVTESDGAFVYFTSTAQEDLNNSAVKVYNDAADLIADTDGIYGIVPCTADAEVMKNLFNFVTNQSGEQVPYPKYLYGSCDIPTEEKLNGTYLTVTDSSASGNTTAVTFSKSPLLAMATVVKGDVLRIGDKSYNITGSNHKDKVYVAGDQTANITSGAVADIYHTLTDNAQIVASIIAAKPVADRRASIVFADGPMYNGQSVPNYCVAAALAGMRSGTYPHAPLSNVTVTAVTTSQEHGFTASQLKQLGAYGFWRVGQNEEGVVISRRQLTSAAADDVNLDEQSIVCNIDSICISLKTTGRDLVGNSNISPMLLTLLKSTLLTKLEGFQQYATDLIGPQLLSASLDSIEQDEIHKDRIYADMSGQPPKPFNKFHMRFYMN